MAKKTRKKTFRDYLREAERLHEYQVRILDVLTDEMIQIIEGLFNKWRLEKFPSKPKEIPFHRNPEGFKGVHSGTVYILDGIVTKDPVPPHIAVMIAHKCALPKNEVIVMTENDPALEVESMISKFGQGGEVSKLMDGNYSEAEPVDHSEYFGQEFLEKVLNDISEDSKEKNAHVFKMMKQRGKEKV